MSKYRKVLVDPFRTLRHGTFAKLFISQTASLAGSSFTWLGLALLAYQLDPERSAIILATTLTLRVAAYILFSPFAGVVSEQFKRKNILWVTQAIRVVTLFLLFLINSEYQLYLLVFLIQFKNPPPLVVVMFFGAMPKFDNFAK